MLTKVKYNQILGGAVNVLDFGAQGVGLGHDDTDAFEAALSATTGYVVVPQTSSFYNLTRGIFVAHVTYTAKGIIGTDGWPIVKFTGLGAAEDCLTIGTVQNTGVALRSIIIDANATGRDGVVLASGQLPVFSSVQIANAQRDALVLSCVNDLWIQAGSFYDIYIQNAGRHGVREQLSGAGGCFINELLWANLGIYGVSKRYNTGSAIRATNTMGAPGAGNKFGNQYFPKITADAQFNTGDPFTPDVNAINIDSGTAENWQIGPCAGIENTGSSAALTGKVIAATGTGSLSGGISGQPPGGNLWGSGTTATGYFWIQEFANGNTYVPGVIASTNLSGTTVALNNGNFANLFTLSVGQTYLVTGNNSGNGTYMVAAYVSWVPGPGLNISHIVDGINRAFTNSGATLRITLNAGGPGVVMQWAALRLN